MPVEALIVITQVKLDDATVIEDHRGVFLRKSLGAGRLGARLASLPGH